MPGSPRPAMAKDVPVLEIVELLVSFEVVGGEHSSRNPNEG